MSASDATFAGQYEAYRLADLARWNELSTATSWLDVWDARVDARGGATVAMEAGTGASWTYEALDAIADHVAAWVHGTGDRMIALNSDNSLAFLAGAIGILKAGACGVLINTREPAERAAELARRAGCRHVLGTTGLPGLQHQRLDQVCQPSASIAPREWRAHVTLDDAAFIIFTSGTSGRSKAARFSHRRLAGAGIAWGHRTGMTPTDRCYIPLPMFHGNGLAVAFASCVEVGAVAVLRQRFSASRFLDDVRAHRCTAVVYIGELWRYLSRQPQRDDDHDNPLRIAFGNGLGADLWQPTVQRFGLAHIVEHWGATELPAGALLNWTDRPGFCGFVPRDHADAAGILIVDDAFRPVPPGTPGELLLRCPAPYRGYLDADDNPPKVRTDVLEPGDHWWRSGDCLTWHADGFFTFVDRLGDSFRWKGENVSSLEVEEALHATGLVSEAVVYGVTLPHHDGKAGMASLVPLVDRNDFDAAALLERLRGRLAPYAIPRMLRLQSEPHATTSTLKIQKQALAARGVDGADYLLIGDRYEPMSARLLAELQRGALTL
ncbi:MAG: AMP-binding protein [Planctomycetota bacterium]